MARLKSPVPMTKLYFKTDYDTGDEKQVVAIMGSISQLGHWDVTDCLITSRERLSRTTWIAELMLPSGMGFQWKWAVLSSADHRMIRWEERIDRHFQVPTDDCIIYALWNEDFEKLPAPIESDSEKTRLPGNNVVSTTHPKSSSRDNKKQLSLTANGITQFKPLPIPSAIVTTTCVKSPKKEPETCEKEESRDMPIKNMMTWCAERKCSIKIETIQEENDSNETQDDNPEPETKNTALLSPTKSYSSPAVTETDQISRGENETSYDQITIASPIRQSNSFVTVYRRIGDFVMSNIIRDMPCSIL